jgi:hypothetical protein
MYNVFIRHDVANHAELYLRKLRFNLTSTGNARCFKNRQCGILSISQPRPVAGTALHQQEQCSSQLRASCFHALSLLSGRQERRRGFVGPEHTANLLGWDNQQLNNRPRILDFCSGNEFCNECNYRVIQRVCS